MKVDFVRFKNFRGQTAEYRLEDVTLVAGANSVGKTTISKAIQLALLGFCPGDEIDRKADKIYDAYCSTEGMMSVEISVGGLNLERTFEKHKGSVKQELTLNAKKLKLGENVCDKLDIKLFNPAEFWRAPNQKRVAIICDIAGIDPAELSGLDDQLAEVNHAKNSAQAEQKKATQALKDHEGELQNITKTDEGIDLSGRQDRLVEVKKDIQNARREIRSSEDMNAERESKIRRLSQAKREMDDLNKNPPVSEEIRKADTSELEKEISIMDKQKLVALNQKNILSEIERLQGYDCPAVEITEDDIYAISEQIVKAEAGLGEVTDVDRAVYEFAKELLSAIGDSASIEIIKELAMPYRNRVKAAEDKTGYDKVVELRQKKKEIQDKQQESLVLKARYEEAQAQIVNLSNDLADIKKEAESYDRAMHDKLITELAQRKSENQRADEAETYRLHYKEKMEALINEVTELNKAAVEEPINIEQMEKQLQALVDEESQLELCVKEIHEWQKIESMVEMKRDYLQKVGQEVTSLKSKEKDLLAKKQSLLAKVKETIEDTANKVLSPATLDMDLDGKNVKFKLNHKGNSVIREACCGAEAVEFDLALARAMTDNGLIFSEVSELDPERLTGLIEKVTAIKGAQYILTGHSIESDKAYTINVEDKAQKSEVVA